MIPKLIHRFWLGPNTPPYNYAAEWAATNPGWVLLTWTDQTIENLFPLHLQAEYDAAPTVVHRKDIALVEAVYKLGGVGVDFDMEPLRPLTDLISDDNLCWSTPDADGFAGNAFFGAVPEHRAMRHVLDTIHTRIERDGWAPDWPQPHIDTGPWAWGEAFGRHHEHAADYGMDILGTWKTAYPIGYGEKELFDQPTAYALRTRDSIVVHRFAGSWLTTDVAVRR